MITCTRPQPADFADVRATNLAVGAAATSAPHAPCSRADIAASTGLNKATVSSLVADLHRRRLVRETGLTENRIGRPATMLVLDGSPYAAIGLEISADHLTAVAVDLAGERLLSWRRAFPGVDAGPASRGRRRRAGPPGGHDRMAKEPAGARPDRRRARPGRRDGGVRSPPNLGWRDVPTARRPGEGARRARLPGRRSTTTPTWRALAEHRFGPYAGTPTWST